MINVQFSNFALISKALKTIIGIEVADVTVFVYFRNGNCYISPFSSRDYHVKNNAIHNVEFHCGGYTIIEPNNCMEMEGLGFIIDAEFFLQELQIAKNSILLEPYSHGRYLLNGVDDFWHTLYLIDCNFTNKQYCKSFIYGWENRSVLDFNSVSPVLRYKIDCDDFIKGLVYNLSLLPKRSKEMYSDLYFALYNDADRGFIVKTFVRGRGEAVDFFKDRVLQAGYRFGTDSHFLQALSYNYLKRLNSFYKTGYIDKSTSLMVKDLGTMTAYFLEGEWFRYIFTSSNKL